MAIAFKTQLGSNNNKTSGTSLVITTTAAIAVGDLVIVFWSSDNLASAGPSVTVTDSGGNTWSSNLYDYSGGTAAGTIAGGVAYCKAANAISTGGTITLTFSGAIAAKAALALSFTGVDITFAPAINYGANISGTTVTLNCPSVGAIGELVFCHCAVEDSGTPTGDSDTLDGSWSAGIRVGSSGGGAASNVYSFVQYKIVTGFNNQQWNLTGLASTDARFHALVFKVAVLGPSYDAGVTKATSTVSATQGPPKHTGSDTEKSTHVLSVSFKPAHFEPAVLVTSTNTITRTSRRGGIGIGSDSESATSTVSATGGKGPDAPVGSGSGSANSTSTVSASGKRNSKGSDTETSTSTVSVSSKRVAARSAGTTTSTSTVTATFKPAHFETANLVTATNTVGATGAKPAGAGSGSGGVVATSTVSATGKTGRFASGGVTTSTHTVTVAGGRVAAKSAGVLTSTSTVSVSHKSARVETALPAVKSTSTVTTTSGKVAFGNGGTVKNTASTANAIGKTGRQGTSIITSTNTFTATWKRFSSEVAFNINSTSVIQYASEISERYGNAGVIKSTSTVFGTNEIQPVVLNEADAIYIGSTPAVRVYLGGELVWEKK